MESLGRHIIAELYDCHPEKTDDVMFVQMAMEAAALEAGATIINTTFHHFAPFGVSGVIVIQESHLSIHTWPEYGFASVDIFTCGETVNPWKAAEVLAKRLGAKHHSAVEMRRGQKEMLKRQDYQANRIYPNKQTKSETNREVWFTERSEDYAFSVKHQGDLLFRKKSVFQRVDVYQTAVFGKMLVLDGVIVLTENDGFVYHEMITHIAVLGHSKPANILVLGGGDGAVVKELLKHEEIESITVLEIDKEVKEVSKRFFPDLYQAFESDKVTLHIGDVADYLMKFSTSSFDLIIDDLQSPIERGEINETTYGYLKNVVKLLSPEGVLVTSVGAPNLNKQQFRQRYKFLEKIFGVGKSTCYLASIPTYPTGLWSFVVCSKNGKLNIVPDNKRQDKLISQNQFQYYSKEIHEAAFALPVYVKKMLE
ncbi:MAG: polyamine aminopropyltransferase [Bacteroidota bacterium]